MSFERRRPEKNQEDLDSSKFDGDRLKYMKKERNTCNAPKWELLENRKLKTNLNIIYIKDHNFN